MSTKLLDGLRELMIQHIDPSGLNNDPVLGLQEKEKILSNFTEEKLREQLDDYDEVESTISSTFEDNNFVNFLLTGDLKYMRRILLPVIRFIDQPCLITLDNEIIDFPDAMVGVDYNVGIDLKDGNIKVNQFIMSVTTFNKDMETDDTLVTLVSDSLISDYHKESDISLVFLHEGIYTVSVKFEYISNPDIYVMKSFTVVVIDAGSSTSS